MVVIVLENVPNRLRGILSRWCLEVRAGLFVGRVDARMQEKLWEKIDDPADVERWALSYGGEAEVISPPVMRHRVARKARRMAAICEEVCAVEKPEDA